MFGIRQFRSEGFLSYIVYDRALAAVLIDPRLDLMGDYREFLLERGLKPVWAVDTRLHADHPSAIHLVAGEFGVPNSHPPRKLKQGDRIEVGSLAFNVLTVSGPTEDSIALYLEKAGDGREGIVFSGEAAGQGLSDSLKKLPPSTLLFPAYCLGDLLFSTVKAELEGKEPLSPSSSIGVTKYALKLKEQGAGCLFLDVREPGEFQAGHMPGARNMPLSEVALHLDEISKAKRVYVSCLSGGRSLLAAKTLSYLGLPDVVNVTGGYRAWLQAELPTEKG
ncbi:MAG: rhodanese-like domain-containing protein [Oligoflexia bacterium]|nr:rhodanese-like domain-containing protein [Oligoflexia bacterium]